MSEPEPELIIDQFALQHAAYVMGDLLPCPFCGKPDPFSSATSKTGLGGRLIYQTRISCMNDTSSYNGQSCHANVFFNAYTLEESRPGAFARWNRRAAVPTPSTDHATKGE